MNKRAIVKLILLIGSSAISLNFMINTVPFGIDSLFNPLLIIDFFLASTIFMYSVSKKIKRHKFLYDVILLLLLFFSVIYIFYYVFSYLQCSFDLHCGVESNYFFEELYPIPLFLILFLSIKDTFKKTNKTNDILTIVISIIVLLVHIRYYMDPIFLHNFITIEYDQLSYHYVQQNYVYFVLMYFLILIHYWVNKKDVTK